MRSRLVVVIVLLGVACARSAWATLVAVAFEQNSQLYRIDSSTGSATSIGATGFGRLNSLAADPSGKLYSVGRAPGSFRDDRLITINPVTGAATSVATVTLGSDTVSVRGLAFAPDGSLYVSNAPLGNSGVGPHDLWRLDVASGIGTKVGGMGISLQSLDFGPDGELYGWDFASLTRETDPGFRGMGLVRVDKTTAAVTDVAPSVNSVDNTIQGIVFSADGNLYGISPLFVLDPATGALRATRSAPALDLRGIEEINIPEPHAIGLAAGAASAGLLRRRRR